MCKKKLMKQWALKAEADYLNACREVGEQKTKLENLIDERDQASEKWCAWRDLCNLYGITFDQQD